MDKGKGVVLFFRILCLILLVVFMISIIKFCFGSSTSVSFAGFLNYISNTPQISVNYQKVASVAGSWPDWALWLKAIITVFTEIINVVWWIMRNVANLLTVVTYYVVYIFI